MKKTKLFFGETRLKDVYVGATKWEVFKFKSVKILRKVLIVAFFLGAITGSYKVGALYTMHFIKPVTVFADKIVPTPVMPAIPVMDRISQCESSNNQLNKDGQVLIHVNTNGTYDIGLFQINSLWNATATKMGYDLTKQADNIAFAQWLYLNKGTSAWSASSGCWNK